MTANSIVKLLYKGKEGLGVIVGNHIVTCGHILNSINPTLDFTDLIEVFHPGSGKKYVQFVSYASSIDLMVLAPQPMFMDYPDHESEMASELYEEYGSEIRIAKSLKDGKNSGHFYRRDGVTRVDCDFELIQSPSIWFTCEEVVPGCSGGPLFNQDNELVGIIVGSVNGDQKTSRAIRLDISLPLYIFNQL